MPSSLRAALVTGVLIAGLLPAHVASAVAPEPGSSPSAVDTAGAPPAVALDGGNRYGLAMGSYVLYYPEDAAARLAEQKRQLDVIASTGAKRIRLDLKWDIVQPTGPKTFRWSRFDSFYDAAVARGLTVLVTIVGAPPWARNPACASAGDTCAPSDPSLFGAFTRAAVDRYSERGIHEWEIWNEPNLNTFWKPAPNAADYTALLRAGYAAVKAADPAATVVSGGLASVGNDSESGNVAPVDFLSQMYAAGAKGAFDAFGHHPYCWGQPVCPTPPASPDTGSGWSMMNDTDLSLRDLMVANRDGGKKIWATEFGAPTNGGASAKTEAQQSTMLTQAYARFSAQAWAGPLYWYSYKDIGTSATDYESWFGMVRPDGSRKPAYYAFTRSIAAASS